MILKERTLNHNGPYVNDIEERKKVPRH